MFSFFPDGGIVAESGPANFQFQALLEYLVGMKLSAVNQNDEVCISALHQSSGNFSNRYANIKYFNPCLILIFLLIVWTWFYFNTDSSIGESTQVLLNM